MNFSWIQDNVPMSGLLCIGGLGASIHIKFSKVLSKNRVDDWSVIEIASKGFPSRDTCFAIPSYPKSGVN